MLTSEGSAFIQTFSRAELSMLFTLSPGTCAVCSLNRRLFRYPMLGMAWEHNKATLKNGRGMEDKWKCSAMNLMCWEPTESKESVNFLVNGDMEVCIIEVHTVEKVSLMDGGYNSPDGLFGYP